MSVVAGTFVTAQGGSIVIAADGSYIYTPPADFHGTDTVDYTVTDGSLTDTATLTLTVTPVCRWWRGPSSPPRAAAS
ncbi:Ig-like domain-containing protein [Pseudomonas stutzeri]|nr:Ig-like domain-containing protein [Stutzerimonas stutzeri]